MISSAHLQSTLALLCISASLLGTIVDGFSLSTRINVSKNSQPFSLTTCHRSNNRRRGDDDYYPDDDPYDEYDDEFFDRSRQERRIRRRDYDDLGGYYEANDGLDVPSSYGRRDGWRLPESVSKALLAGVFVLGVGLGVTVDSQINTNPKDLASRDAIDQAAPNSKLCATMGASAMAFDQRVFVSFNPFNVYVAQADVKPACGMYFYFCNFVLGLTFH